VYIFPRWPRDRQGNALERCDSSVREKPAQNGTRKAWATAASFSRRLLAQLLLPALLLSCRTTAHNPLPGGYFLLVGHEGGGPAPIGSVLAVYPDGTAVYRSADGRSRRFDVPPELLNEIRNVLRGPQLQLDLRARTASSARYADYEQWWFWVNGEESSFVCREVSPSEAMLTLIHAAQRVASQRTHEGWFLSPPCLAKPEPGTTGVGRAPGGVGLRDRSE
jgi:hypothetical protein